MIASTFSEYGFLVKSKSGNAYIFSESDIPNFVTIIVIIFLALSRSLLPFVEMYFLKKF